MVGHIIYAILTIALTILVFWYAYFKPSAPLEKRKILYGVGCLLLIALETYCYMQHGDLTWYQAVTANYKDAGYASFWETPGGMRTKGFLLVFRLLL